MLEWAKAARAALVISFKSINEKFLFLLNGDIQWVLGFLMCSRRKFHQDFKAGKSNPDVKLPQFILLLLSEVRLFYHPNSYILLLFFSPVHFSKIHPLGKEIESHTLPSTINPGNLMVKF